MIAPMKAPLELFTAGREILQMAEWYDRRTKLYGLAEAAARRRGKPLLVVGRPRSRSHG